MPRWPVLLAAALSVAPAVHGQRITFDPSARVVGVWIRANPVPWGGVDHQVAISQTSAAAALRAGSYGLIASVNLESATMPDGELTPGAWGEGFVDRRHPHTTVHELMLTGRDVLGDIDGPGELGLFAGKGFVPFGTDDPMMRPFQGFPVNHHLSQILERAVAGVQYRLHPVTIEAALFNGDEPERASQWPMIRLPDGTWRFGDSWSLRLLLEPTAGTEIQASVADMHSPEHRLGAGGNARKYSTSVRTSRSVAEGEGLTYLLAEWARTEELNGYFVYSTILAEIEQRYREWAVAYRFERTTRPEEERLTDPYRSLRPHLENSILGMTRWSLHTARVSRQRHAGSDVRLTPFAEVTMGSVAKSGQGIIDVDAMYGNGGVAHLRFGMMLDWRGAGHRMGRYGVLEHAGH